MPFQGPVAALRAAVVVGAACSVVAVTFVANKTIGATVMTESQQSQDTAPRRLREDDLKSLKWRSIGPANMGGRVAALALSRSDPRTYLIGYATGGIWKTTNNGTTYSPIFDKYETSSIGALALCDAPADWPGWQHEKDIKPDADLSKLGRNRIIWVGTGEGNNRNSSSWGHGVYRSTDGGEKFTYIGLKKTHEIPAIAVDPRDVDTCYVAALGHLWGHNAERGLYKTTDGGESWQHVLAIDDKTGACDVVIDPNNPDTVYAAMYARKRTVYSYQGVSESGGIFKSTDGGASWSKLSKGLPQRTGRIGLSIHAANPNIIMAVVDSDEGGWAGEAFADHQRVGGVFRSEDGGQSWKRTSNYNPRPFYFSRIAIDPEDDQRVYLAGWEVYISEDGGRTFRAGSAKTPHVDYHAIIVDPTDTNRILIGNDGGMYMSWDRGKTWDFHNHMAVGQFYNVAVDDSDPYRVGGGLQDNGSWIGPSETITRAPEDIFMGRSGSITNAEWQFVHGGDGFHVAFDPTDRNVIYAEWQGGNIARIHLDTGRYHKLRPQPREGQPRFRFNWNAPFFISPHDPTTLYLGGNCVFKLTKRGNDWKRISDDLSTGELHKMITEGSEAETYGTIVALAESSIAAGTLWAGTDDGRVHVTTDDGATWSDVTPKQVDGLYIAKIEPSHAHAGAAYVAVDGHRSDVFKPILLKTTDGGASWTNIGRELPKGAPIKSVREDPRNPNVLYIGTERASHVSVDGGGHWAKLNGKSLPTVAVDDLVIQSREMDLVAGTHGRSIWILDDISAISQLMQEVLDSAFHVFDPQPGQPRHFMEYGGLWSDKMFIADNAPMGAAIQYWIRDYAGDEVKITIKDKHDHEVRKLTGTNHPGINRVVWDLQADSKQKIGDINEETEFVPAGEYTATVSYGDDHKQTVTVTVLDEPGGRTGAGARARE